jgi:hypothetical protein
MQVPVPIVATVAKKIIEASFAQSLGVLSGVELKRPSNLVYFMPYESIRHGKSNAPQTKPECKAKDGPTLQVDIREVGYLQMWSC